MRNSLFSGLLAIVFLLAALVPTSVYALDNLSKGISKEELRRQLAKEFPRGTSREVVEKELVGKAGAKPQADSVRTNKITYHYKIPSLAGHPDPSVDPFKTITVMYDAENKVHQISGSGPGGPVLPQAPPRSRSDATVFQFEDYQSAEQLVATLRELFPLDTERSYIEKVLVKWAGAEIFGDINTQRVLYSERFANHFTKDVYRDDFVWNVQASYTKSGHLDQLTITGSTAVSAFDLHDRDKMKIHKSRVLK